MESGSEARSREAVAFGARLHRVVRQVLDTRIELLAIMMIEAGIEAEAVRQRLALLVKALRSPVIDDTIFENGRRMATAVEDGRIRFNRELLQRVDDSEVLTALAKPVAQITELASVGVSLAFQIDDDQLMRDLTMKTQRRVDSEVVRASSITEWVQYRLDTMAERVVGLTNELGRPTDFDAVATDALREQVAAAPVWPEWSDVEAVDWCADAVRIVRESTSGTPIEDHAELLVGLLWDSVVLSTQSFLRHAGRTLRPFAAQLDLCEVVEALTVAVSTEESVRTDVAGWTAYVEIAELWAELNREERAQFGHVVGPPVVQPASVIAAAGLAFGLDRPSDLPWSVPLVCWTTREQRALRDLLAGMVKLMPMRGTVDTGVPSAAMALAVTGEAREIQLQVVDEEPGVDAAPHAPRGAFGACVREVVQRFEASDEMLQEAALASVRGAYDEWFPASHEMWKRRLYAAERGGVAQFEALVAAIDDVFAVPMFFDPFQEPGDDQFRPMAGLVMPVALDGEVVTISVPIAALTATPHGGALTLRAVDVRTTPPQWLGDRMLHLESLSQQPVEQVLRAVHHDAIQMLVTVAPSG